MPSSATTSHSSPVSSATSRSAASRHSSSGWSLPFGSDQSSYFGLWTTATSFPPPSRSRTTTPPAASISTGWSGVKPEGRRYSGRARPTLSATQAGLSEPSTSTVNRVTTCHHPPPTSSTSVTSAVALIREPDGTGAGKRTRFHP